MFRRKLFSLPSPVSSSCHLFSRTPCSFSVSSSQSATFVCAARFASNTRSTDKRRAPSVVSDTAVAADSTNSSKSAATTHHHHEQQNSPQAGVDENVSSFLNQFQYAAPELGLKLSPPDMAVELLEYQKEGVGWMARREHFYSGGVMSDFLGMGKTVQMLALCLARQTTSKHVDTAIEQQQAQVNRMGFAHGEPFRIQTVISQLLQMPAVVNCSKITQPGRSLLTLQEEIATVVRDHGRVPEKKSLEDLRAVAKELNKWLSFAGRYYESWEKRARHFLAQKESEEGGGGKNSGNNLSGDLETPELRTLVIVPASLMFQWKHEIDTKIDAARGIRTLIYHGERARSKEASVADLEMHDFVITTYESVVRGASAAFVKDASMRRKRPGQAASAGGGRRGGGGMSNMFITNLGGAGGGAGGAAGVGVSAGAGGGGPAVDADGSADFSAHESMRSAMFNRAAASPLFRVRWKRIILDEAHYVRNEHTSRFRAIRQLLGLKRWAVTATPLHNSIADLQTLLTFVGQPKLPIFAQNESTLLRDPVMQRAIARSLQPAFLRRTPVMTRGGVKMTLVSLPSKDDVVVRGDLSADEVQTYNTALTMKQQAMSKLKDQRNSFIHIFAMMTLLRQACCHPWMTDGKKVVVQVCFLCKMEVMNPIITRCGHSYCAECLHMAFRSHGNSIEQQHLEQQSDPSLASSSITSKKSDALSRQVQNNSVVRLPCPACDVPIPFSIFAAAPKASSSDNISSMKKKPWRSSTKLDMLLDAIKHILDKHPGEKVVVFAQFTTLLDIVSVAFDKIMPKMRYVRIDGSLSLKMRNGLISAFTEDPEVKVLLASKMAMGVGLNLTAANHVIVLDPWWNPRVEEQAVHRCHRIGQKKHVNVQRFVMNDTIEQYCYEISRKKKDFGDAVLRAATAEGQQQDSADESPAKQVANMVRTQLKPIGAGGGASAADDTAASS